MGSEITSRHMAEEMLVQKAAQDDAFRKQLVTDPKGTIFKTLGIRLPDDVKINVLEETVQSLYLVLPVKSTASGELAEHELAKVAGGTDTASDKSIYTATPGTMAERAKTAATVSD
jgi:hypothetical protein